MTLWFPAPEFSSSLPTAELTNPPRAPQSSQAPSLGNSYLLIIAQLLQEVFSQPLSLVTRVSLFIPLLIHSVICSTDIYGATSPAKDSEEGHGDSLAGRAQSLRSHTGDLGLPVPIGFVWWLLSPLRALSIPQEGRRVRPQVSSSSMRPEMQSVFIFLCQ